MKPEREYAQARACDLREKRILRGLGARSGEGVDGVRGLRDGHLHGASYTNKEWTIV